jgi:hypothetical protein
METWLSLGEIESNQGLAGSARNDFEKAKKWMNRLTAFAGETRLLLHPRIEDIRRKLREYLKASDPPR